MPMTRRQTGFTLIEIMIAVAILAIIAAIAIPAYQGYILESRYGTALQDMRQMQLILDDLASDNDLGALDGDNLNELGVFMGPDGSIAFALPTAANGPGGEAPWLDPWGNIYRYDRDDTATSPQEYTLTSYGPDGAAGGGDDASPN
jgi:prepilin-type N-terminal cleavage/methylation domain-containing protein